MPKNKKKESSSDSDSGPDDVSFMKNLKFMLTRVNIEQYCSNTLLIVC